MNFKYFCLKTDLIEQFDAVLNDYTSLTEANLADLSVSAVIMDGINNMKSKDVKSIISTLAVVAKLTGRTVKDIIKLFSREGFTKIKDFIQNDIIGSEEIQFMLNIMEDPNYYKGYKGLEHIVLDMKNNNPKLASSFRKIVDKILQ